MNPKRFGIFVVILRLVLLTPIALNADHPPKEKIALGRPERTLAGITIGRTTIAEAVRLYGEPSAREPHPDQDDATRGERSYIWQKSGLRISVGTWFQPGKESRISSVELSGTDTGSVARSARGLRLGGTFDDVKRVYGSRFQTGFKNDRTRYVVLQWKDETELDIDFARDGRIDHLLLLAPVE